MSGAGDGLCGATQTDVVAAALDQHGGKFDRKHRLQKRDVAPDQLFLQTDRVSRHDDFWSLPIVLLLILLVFLRVFFSVRPAAFLSGQNGGNKISETLADPRPGFRDQMPSVTDCGAMRSAISSCCGRAS
ncbi:MAG: hypothetical protein R3C19_18755 [Planctomycetaceae bacterium]